MLDKKQFLPVVLLASSLALSACSDQEDEANAEEAEPGIEADIGNGNGNGEGNGNGNNTTADRITINASALAAKPKGNGELIETNFDSPVEINLSDFDGEALASLLQLPEGNYQQIIFTVDTADDVEDSVQVADASFPLQYRSVPFSARGNFTTDANGLADFAGIDLGKALNQQETADGSVFYLLDSSLKMLKAGRGAEAAGNGGEDAMAQFSVLEMDEESPSSGLESIILQVASATIIPRREADDKKADAALRADNPAGINITMDMPLAIDLMNFSGATIDEIFDLETGQYNHITLHVDSEDLYEESMTIDGEVASLQLRNDRVKIVGGFSTDEAGVTTMPALSLANILSVRQKGNEEDTVYVLDSVIHPIKDEAASAESETDDTGGEEYDNVGDETNEEDDLL